MLRILSFTLIHGNQAGGEGAGNDPVKSGAGALQVRLPAMKNEVKIFRKGQVEALDCPHEPGKRLNYGGVP